MSGIITTVSVKSVGLSMPCSVVRIDEPLSGAIHHINRRYSIINESIVLRFFCLSDLLGYQDFMIIQSTYRENSMYTKEILSLEDARRVAAAAEAEAQKNGWNVVIAIVDDGGHLMYLQREKVQLGSVDVAITKAKVALMFRRPTKFWEEMVASGRQGYLAMPGMLPIEGGIPLISDGEIIGAIGISGVKSNEDGQIAEAGAKAL
jgi:uncharacterized protein GlcG (DUF336 family)